MAAVRDQLARRRQPPGTCVAAYLLHAASCLHHNERGLAPDLLGGAEASARLSDEDLLGLVRG